MKAKEDTKGAILVEALLELFACKKNTQLAKKLGIADGTISYWQNNALTKTIIKKALNPIVNKIDGTKFVDQVKRNYHIKTDSQVARKLGVTQPALNGWRNTGITLKTLNTILTKSHIAHSESIISPIIEYYPIQKTKSKQKKNSEFVDIKNGNGNKIKEMLGKKGVYIFYNSQGKAIYIGKAKKQSLFKELKLAYNRNRGIHQKIRNVYHPSSKNPSSNRKIKEQQIPLHDIATYFSAYCIEETFIDNFEASIIRMFSNDLLNKKIESISRTNPEDKLRKKKLP